jgi:hypothetical protein
MSDPRPREFERDPNLQPDPNLPRNRYVESSGSNGAGWLIAAVIAVALLGFAAYSFRGTEVSSLSQPDTTAGQGMRAPVPTTPPAAPVAPAPRTDSAPAQSPPAQPPQ